MKDLETINEWGQEVEIIDIENAIKKTREVAVESYEIVTDAVLALFLSKLKDEIKK